MSGLIVGTGAFTGAVLVGAIELQYQHVPPFLVSSVIGSIIGGIYFQLVGYKVAKFGYLPVFMIAALFGVFIFTIGYLGLGQYWLFNDVAVSIGFGVNSVNSPDVTGAKKV